MSYPDRWTSTTTPIERGASYETPNGEVVIVLPTQSEDHANGLVSVLIERGVIGRVGRCILVSASDFDAYRRVGRYPGGSHD